MIPSDNGTGKNPPSELLQKSLGLIGEDLSQGHNWVASKHGKLLYVIGITIIFTFYEAIKTVFWPHISLWESHVISIIMVAVLSTIFVSWFRQIYNLQNQKLRTVNEHLLHEITEHKQAEKELYLLEERFSKAFNACHGPMSISTFPDGRYIDVNEAFLQVLGYRREDVIGFTRSELNIWERPKDLERATQSLFERKSFRNLEASICTKSGELRLGLLSADILEISGENYVLVVFEDITERKLAEEALKQSEEKYRSLVVNLNDVIYTINAEGYITYISPVVEHLAGYQAEEIIGTPFLSYIHPEDLKGLMERFTRSLSGQVDPVDFRILRKDGTSIYVRSCRRVLVENGQVSVTGVLSDITERKRAEETLRQSEERFSKAFHSNPCAMSIMRLSDYQIINVNQRWLDATGFSREDAVGKQRKVIDISKEQQRQQANDLVNEYGSAANLETVIRNKKGEERDILWSGEIITLDGEPCLLGAWIDITERKKYEKEIARLDRLSLMGEIAGGIAHEIRNPMTVVRGYLQFIQDKEEYVSQKKRFDTMIGELDRANAIITEFLSLSRNEPTELTRQSINNVVTVLLPLIQADAAKNQIAVSVDLIDVPDLNLDEKQVRQLILNLTRNGIEVMSIYGELTIKTRLERGRVVLSIQDRGNGIPPDVLEKLGTPFFTTKEKGTGLGLAVCFRIAESHNARIEIETGKSGTTFMVSFPMPENTV